MFDMGFVLFRMLVYCNKIAMCVLHMDNKKIFIQLLLSLVQELEHAKKRLVVLTMEWLSWLHGLIMLVSEANCIKQPERQFPCCFLLFSLFSKEEKRRKLVVSLYCHVQ